MSREKNRTCYECKNFSLCFARRKFDEAIQYSLGVIDVDKNDWQEIYVALAVACKVYDKREENE